MLSVVTWDGEAGDGLWQNPINWQDEVGNDVLPGAADDVVIDVAGDITVNLSSGAQTINSLNCQETLNISGGSLDIAAASQINSLTLSNGTLSGSGDVTTAKLTWSAGTMSGTATTTILDDGDPTTIELEIGYGGTLDARTLVNQGTATRASSTYRLGLENGAVFENHGDLELLGGGGVSSSTVDGRFDNYGRLIKSGAGSFFFSFGHWVVPFNNYGTVDVQEGRLGFYGGYTQTAGETKLNGGSVSSPTPLDIQGGALTGLGDIYGSVSNSGHASPGLPIGAITIDGNYNQSSAGALNIEIGGLIGGTEYDQLHVIGGVTLGGTLNVSVLDPFVPAFGDQFVIVNNDGDDEIEGTLFDGLPDGATFTVGATQFEISYFGTDGTGNDVVLTAVNQPPVADAGGGAAGVYLVDEGSSVTLDASASFDPNQDPDTLTYEWDFDYDGETFDVDATSITAPFDAVDGPASFTVAVRVTDYADVSDIATAMVEVNNVAPSASLRGPVEGLRDQSLAFTLGAADPAAADQAAGFTYDIDWNSDGVVDQTVSGADALEVSHVFTESGPAVVTVTATDKDGGTSGPVSVALDVIEPVEIDVKPGSEPNSINVESNGQISVAVFTTDEFDAATIDASTVVFAGAYAVQSGVEDVDGDGDLDMVLHFRTQETNLREVYDLLLAEDLDAHGIIDSTRQVAQVSLEGETLDDIIFQGIDEVDLLLRGKILRELLDELAAAGAI